MFQGVKILRLSCLVCASKDAFVLILKESMRAKELFRKFYLNICLVLNVSFFTLEVLAYVLFFIK